MSVFTEQPVSLQDSKLPQSIEIDDSFCELQSELPDSAYAATTSDGKTVIVPQVQSMKEYILLHYKQALTKALCESVARQAVLYGWETVEVIEDTCRITHMRFWRDTSTAFTADLRMSADILSSSAGVDSIRPGDDRVIDHAIAKTLEKRGDGGTGWSLGWKVNIWARLGDGDRALRLLERQLRLVDTDETNSY